MQGDRVTRKLRSNKSKQIRTELEPQNKDEMSGLEKTLNEINKQLDMLNKKMSNAEIRDKEISERLEKIEANMTDWNETKKEIDKILAENRIQKAKIKTLEAGMRRFKADKLKKSIEIFGISEMENENPKEILYELARKANYNLTGNDLVDSFRPRRNGSADKEKPIKAKLASVKIKNDLVKAIRLKKMRLGDIGRQPENKRIYVNEANIPETKRLLYLAKEHAIRLGWHKTWIYANEVYIVRQDKEQSIRIQDEEDLAQLVGNKLND